MELGLKRPSLLWFLGPNSIVVLYMEPLGMSRESSWVETAKDLFTRLEVGG